MINGAGQKAASGAPKLRQKAVRKPKENILI
jgi:hypothetical protein